MKAFIVRPFGVKSDIDFDKVQKELIDPALRKNGIDGATTGEIVEAGNIREDMFQLLLTSDLVIADISLYNPNVYYELGIRHALRKRHTILIRTNKDAVPFDLKTDRYFKYDLQKLKKGVDRLAKVIKATILSESNTDSPVFKMLPAMVAQDPEKFLAIPVEFRNELETANGKFNGKLGLLSFEATHFPWAIPALRLIGEKQYQAGLYLDAKDTWESIKHKVKGDLEAHDRLATVYQRLAESEYNSNTQLAAKLLSMSEKEIDFLFKKENELSPKYLSEAHALRARNDKERWRRQWEAVAEQDRAKEALRSGLLKSAFENYLFGYDEDLNAYYPGINALGLLKIMIDLADRDLDFWNENYDTDEYAESELKRYKSQFEELAVVIKKTLAVGKVKNEYMQKSDIWLKLTEAELALLTLNRPSRVGKLYQNALEEARKIEGGFRVTSSKRQLLIYQKLGIRPENVVEALKAYDTFPEEIEPKQIHVILFSGHMIDTRDRKKPRFPKEKEQKVRDKIMAALKKILEKLFGDEVGDQKNLKRLVGIAGGACGGDILFHECCRELGIKTQMLLALPAQEFIIQSVQHAGNKWIDRFNVLYNSPNAEVQVLMDKKELPSWLQTTDWAYTFWERNNLWILNSALTVGGRNITFLALWDGKKGDGPGGTENMIRLVKKRGAKSIIVKP